MNECWNSFCLSKSQYGKTGITAYANQRIRFKIFYNRTNLEKTFYQFKWQSNIFYQRTSLNPDISNPFILYPACGTFSISIFPFAPTNKISISGSVFFKAFAIAIAGKICPPVPPPAMMTLLIHLSIICYTDLCLFPSRSTFLATLKIIPMDKQVNMKLVPPILTNGNVTPVTGNKFTVTAIFAIA